MNNLRTYSLFEFGGSFNHFSMRVMQVDMRSLSLLVVGLGLWQVEAITLDTKDPGEYSSSIFTIVFLGIWPIRFC